MRRKRLTAVEQAVADLNTRLRRARKRGRRVEIYTFTDDGMNTSSRAADRFVAVSDLGHIRPKP